MKNLNIQHRKQIIVYFFLLPALLVAGVIHAQRNSPAIVQQQLHQVYSSIKDPEISFEKFAEINSHVFLNNINTLVPVSTYCNKVRAYCTNGDFESGLDQNQYTGAYGTWTANLYPDPFGSSLTAGFSSGPIASSAAHQTIVDVSGGKDAITGIDVTPPGGGSKSLRLGNTAVGAGTELLAKTVVVDPNETILNFYYAPVLQDPGHNFDEQPAFSVRAYDCATGKELPNVCDLGNGTNIAVASAKNPFFKSIIDPVYDLVVYRDWSLAQINLSQYIGKTVIIVFTNKDCNLTGHWGYTYIDNLFSGQCPLGPINTTQGSVSFDKTKVDSCGTGQICTKYSLPFKDSSGTITTGSLRMTLYIYQNSTLVDSLSSPTLTGDSTYCFSINPGQLKLNTALDGFDYTITGRFSLSGFSLSPIILGNPPTGVKNGINNDYFIVCNNNGECTPPTFLNDGRIVLDASCGKNDGAISIIPLSGAGPYMYSIDGGATYVAGPAAGYTFSGLAAGSYQLRLKDANGCESAVVQETVKAVFGGPTFLNNGQIVLDASCGKKDGAIYIIPLTGTAPFMYSIDGGVNYVAGPAAGYTFSGLAAGTYQLRLKDATGCESDVVVRDVKPDAFGPCNVVPIINPSLRAPVKIEEGNGYAFPNPSKGQFKVKLGQLAQGSEAQIVLINAKGSVIQQKAVLVNGNNTVDFDISGKAKGLYFIKITSSSGTKISKIMIQ